MTDNPSRHRQADGYEPRFDLDADYGHQGELFVQDIADAIKTGMVETKRDGRWHDTRNFYVEYECRKFSGKWEKSGLAVTDAPVWAIVLGDTETAIFIPTATLKEFCRHLLKRSQFYKVELNRGSHPTRGVRVPIAELFTWLANRQREHQRGAA